MCEATVQVTDGPQPDQMQLHQRTPLLYAKCAHEARPTPDNCWPLAEAARLKLFTKMCRTVLEHAAFLNAANQSYSDCVVNNTNISFLQTNTQHGAVDQSKQATAHFPHPDHHNTMTTTSAHFCMGLYTRSDSHTAKAALLITCWNPAIY